MDTTPSTTFTCHLASPTCADAKKSIISTKPITNSHAQKVRFWPAIGLDEKVGCFGGGTAQVGGARFGQPASGSQAGQGELRIFAGGDDQAHPRWQVLE